MKNIIYSITTILILISCNEEKEKPKVPFSEYITTSISTNIDSINDSTKGDIWINNHSASKFDYPAYVSIELLDTIRKVNYFSHINLNSDIYSTADNSECQSIISMEGGLSINKTIDFNKLFWDDGISSKDLPNSIYRLGISLSIKEPSNPGFKIQSEYKYLSKY